MRPGQVFGTTSETVLGYQALCWIREWLRMPLRLDPSEDPNEESDTAAEVKRMNTKIVSEPRMGMLGRFL